MIPPHLPAPSSSIHKHRRLERIKFFLLVSFLGLWAGGVGAFVTLGWLWPVAGGGSTWAISYSTTPTTREKLDNTVREQLKSHLVRVYSAPTDIEGQVAYFSSKNLIGQAIILATDGWFALYGPAIKVENVKTWKIVGDDGKIIAINSVFKDPYTGVLYLEAEQKDPVAWRPIEFTDALKTDDVVFVLENSWQSASVEAVIYPTSFSDGHSDAILPAYFGLSRTAPPGSLVVSRQGKFVGFGMGDKAVLQSKVVNRQLPTLLTKKLFTYSSLGIEGWYSVEQPIMVKDRLVSGFLIMKVTAKNSPLIKGDIITEINGEIVEPEKMWYTIQIGKEMRIKVLRSGKNIELRVTPSLL